MASKEKVGEIIRSRRMARGWSQAELAKRVQCSPSAIGMYESGQRYPKPDVIEALADAFNVPKWAITMTEDEVHPADDDIWTLREEERRDPNRKALYMLAKYGTAQDIRQATAIIDALKATNPDYYDGDDPA